MRYLLLGWRYLALAACCSYGQWVNQEMKEKTMTIARKSIAVVAASALALVGLSAPAQAAGLADKSKVSLEPTTGESFRVLAGAGQQISLTSNEAVPVVGGDASFLVTGADVFVVANSSTGVTDADAAAAPTTWERSDGTVTVTIAAHGLAVGAVVYIKADDLVDGGASSDDVAAGYYRVTAVPGVNQFSFEDGLPDVADADGDITGGTVAADVQVQSYTQDADGNIVIDTGVANAGADEVLVLSVNDSATTTATVVAWVDDNNDGDIDATEHTSPTETVYFHGVADLTPSVTWTAAFAVANPSVDVTFAEDINWDQVAASEVTGTFSNFGAQALDADVNHTEDAGVLTIADTSNNALDAGYLSVLLENADGDDIGTFRVNIVDQDVQQLVASVTESSDLAFTQATDADADDNLQDDNGSQAAGTVRQDKDVTVTVTVTDSDGDAVAGVNVTVDTKADSAVGAKDEYKVGSELVDANGDIDAFVLTTDANGQITIPVTSEAAGADGDVIVLTYVAEGVDEGYWEDQDADGVEDAGEYALAEIWLTWKTAVYTTSIVNSIQADAATAGLGANATTAAEVSSLSIQTWTVDQWNVPSSDTYRIKNSMSQDGETKVQYVTVNSSGFATVTVADNADADGGDVTATVTREKYDADNDTWGNSVAVDTVYIDPDAESYTAEVTLAVGAAAAVSTTALVAANTDLGDATPTVGAAIAVSGTADDKFTGAEIEGRQVTISGSSDLLFVADGHYAFGSLTAWSAGDDGAFAFNVYSNVPGKYNVTVTTENGSATKEIEFSKAVKTAGTSMTFTVANAVPGKTMSVTGKLVDAFGNPVDTTGNAQLKITYDAPGFVVGDLPTETGADGTFKFMVLLGSNDTISGTITVAYDQDDNAAFDDDNDLEFTHDLAPAAPAADTKVNAGSFKGYVAIYAKGHEGKRLSAKVGKDWVVVPALASNFVRVVEYTGAGYTISVRIYIDRVLVDTIVVTTK